MMRATPFQDSAGRWRDRHGKFITAPPPRHVEITEYRIVVFGKARSPWRQSWDAALEDAIQAGLASWDESKQEHYLAVPVRMQSRKR